VKRHFLWVKTRWVHYRRLGSGPAVVLLHGSPQSAWSLMPLMRRLAAQGLTAIALDTPGNGLSDPLQGEALDCDAYAAALKETLDALGLGRVGLYGFHTGACIGSTFAARWPERVTSAVYDGFCVWTAAERALILDRYLPEFRPLWDGSHLAWLWPRFEEQSVFFPWHERTAAARMDADVGPPQQVHAGIMEFLRAGDAYRAPYRAAFVYRGEEIAPLLSQPSLICARQGDPLVEHLGRLPPLGPHIATATLERDPAPSFTRFAELFADHTGDAAPPSPAAGADSQGLTRGYLPLPEGEIAWTGALAGAGRPLALLHNPPGSLRMYGPALPGLAASGRPVLALDLPGHGESSEQWESGLASVEAYADVIAQAFEALGLDAPAAAGHALGGQIALELKRRGRGPAALMGAPHWTAEERDELLARYAPSIAPAWDGGHLLRVWRMMTWQALFYPWFRRDRAHAFAREPRLDPTIIHRRTVDVLKAGDRYQGAYAACHAWPTAAKAAEAGGCDLFPVPWDASCTHERVASLAAAAPVRVLDPLPDAIADWAQPLASWAA
jgi:pimeloyl-ACP methyl ester carboxylesterase